MYFYRPCTKSTLLCEVYIEGSLLVAPLLAAQYDETPTQRSGGVAELRRSQVVQQHGPQHLWTEETSSETLQVSTAKCRLSKPVHLE